MDFNGKKSTGLLESDSFSPNYESCRVQNHMNFLEQVV